MCTNQFPHTKVSTILTDVQFLTLVCHSMTSPPSQWSQHILSCRPPQSEQQQLLYEVDKAKTCEQESSIVWVAFWDLAVAIRTISITSTIIVPSLVTSRISNKKSLWSLFMGFKCCMARANLRRQSHFLPLGSEKFQVLILSSSEAWKAESILKTASGFEHGILGLGIQHLDH